ncbi:TRAP transporter substrate-binding protein DctP [Bacillus dakarensis]|uniref:TRAP transporter substrate-binding protein n=1 Tax=Robertmurraya dakarensis TaxID=1926278 RepID=UPI0009818D4A|nr:TRAP transporter substrate-binding protein DctP [Bacillus dakarensis]
MKLKKMMVYTFLTAMLTLVGCSSSSSSNTQEDSPKEEEENVETVTLKVGTYFANTSQMYTLVTDPWMKRVTELTEGKVQFEAYPGEQLGKAHDMLNLTRDGVMDIGVFPTSYFPDNMPISSALSGLPNLSETSQQGTLAYRDLLAESEEILEIDYLKNGVRPLFTHVSPTYEVWTTGKEIRLPEDLKGQKVRTPGGVANDVYEYMGVTPVAVSHTETYEALDKGVIDAVSYYSIAVDSSGTDEILRYAIFPHIGTAIHALSINEKVWSSLSEDVQKAMIQASNELMDSVGVLYDEDTIRINTEFEESGGTIAELTEEELGQWRSLLDKFNEEWLEKNGSGDIPYEQVLNTYKEKLEQYKE